MGLSFFRDSIIVIRAPIGEKNGGEYRDWNNASQFTINNVQVTARAPSQDFSGRLLNVADSRTLRANYDADIQEGDRVAYDGNLYEVDGEVFHTNSPTGRVSSTRCTLTRWTG